MPSGRDTPPSSTFISIKSATGKLSEAPSPRGSPDVSLKSTNLAQDVSQTLLYEKDVWDKARTQEATGCSGKPKPAPASASPVPTGRQRSVLELQTGPGGSQPSGVVRTVTEQYEEVDQYGNSVLTSSTTVTEQAGPPGDPGPHFELQASPFLRQYLHSPTELSGGLGEAGREPVPCGHSQPAAP